MSHPISDSADALFACVTSRADPNSHGVNRSPLLGGRAMVACAEALVREYGVDASAVAALRSAQSIGLDNPYSYCQWREVERVLGWMDAPHHAEVRH